MQRVPVLDVAREAQLLRQELIDAIGSVVDSGLYILGENVGRFEQEAASYLGAGHAVGVNSGTDALIIGLRALGIGSGDEVVTTTFTFFATAEAISAVGATPVFVDIDPATFNLDLSSLEAAITPRTSAVIPVHLFGQAADMDGILELARRHGLAVLEDAAQCFGGEHSGRKLGTIGDVGAFSFFPTKNLAAMGDGGLLVTDDDDVADAARALRSHGGIRRYENERIGYNSRLDEIQAAVLRVKLPRLDRWNEGRRLVAERYTRDLRGIEGLLLPADDGRHVFHQYTVRIGGGRRDEVRELLAGAGIDTMVYYPVPVHRLPVYAAQHGDLSLPAAESASAEVLSLPVSPLPFGDVQDHIVAHLLAAMEGAGRR